MVLYGILWYFQVLVLVLFGTLWYFSVLLPYGGYLLSWKPEFWLDLAQNPMQHFPHPNDASDKIWFLLACWFQRYSCLKVLTEARTEAWMPAQVPSYKLTKSLNMGSGELKKLLEDKNAKHQLGSFCIFSHVYCEVKFPIPVRICERKWQMLQPASLIQMS